MFSQLTVLPVRFPENYPANIRNDMNRMDRREPEWARKVPAAPSFQERYEHAARYRQSVPQKYSRCQELLSQHCGLYRILVCAEFYPYGSSVAVLNYRNIYITRCLQCLIELHI